MERQTGILVEYNKATRDSANATAQSAAATERTVELLGKQAQLMERQLEEMRASTDAAINRDRGRAHIVVRNPDEYKFRYGHKHFDVAFMLSSSGATKVFVEDFRAMFAKTENADITPDYAQCVQFASGGKVIPKADFAPHQVIGVRPDGMLTSDEIEQIQRGELFLHFYGFVRFRDIFERRRRRNIHLRWDGIPESDVTEWHWQLVGAPEENGEIEEKDDNQQN